MKTSSAADDWHNRYLDLESEQKQFRAVEAALKRIAGRLCIAALGQSRPLDAEIKKVQKALRRDATSAELERITASFSDAIAKLESPAPATALDPTDVPSDQIIDAERIHAALSTLLRDLKRDPELVAQVEDLESKFTNAMTPEQLTDTLTALTEMVGERIQRIERAKEEIQILLNHMLGKLNEIGQLVAGQNLSQTQSQASSETLNTQLVGEMKAMGESVESALDLPQIRTHVRRRLDSIGRHLQEFRAREAALAEDMRSRTEHMQTRIAALEAQANKLQAQLRSEQLLATIDLLTRIPNRLAYEKRMEEELKRWERFRQPTCLAVWDVDHFKSINDTYGHRAGDGVLRAIAERLQHRIRSTDFLARYGGEEFVMVLCGTNRADGLRVMDDMRNAIAKLRFNHRGTMLSVTISGGLTELQRGDAAGTAFDRADKALYQAKLAGRNRCCLK